MQHIAEPREAIAMKKHTALVLWIAAVLLQGCGTISGIDYRYPAGWPELMKNHDCPDLEGSYLNRGSSSYSPRVGSHLLSFQLGLSQSALSIDTVQISKTADGEFGVVGLNSGYSFSRRALSLAEKHFACVEGALVLAGKAETQADGFGIAGTNRSLRFSRASDGSLIGEERATVTSLALYFIPIHGTQTFWYRWYPK